MLNQTKVVPFEYDNQSIQVVIHDENPHFILADACKVLDLKNPSVVVQSLDEDERTKLNLGRQGETWVITESGLYHLIFKSRKKKAQLFRKWVTSEVLPTIRKTGSYQSQPVELPSLALPLTDEQKELQRLANKASIIMGTNSKLATRIGCSEATISLMRNGKMSKMSAELQSRAYTVCQHVVNNGIGYDSEAIELLMSIKDNKVRQQLFEKMKKGGAL